jgi:hypothetical protein
VWRAILDAMRDGRVVSNRTMPLCADLRGYVENMLEGLPRTNEPKVPIPFVTTPVLVDNALNPIVVLPLAISPRARRPAAATKSQALRQRSTGWPTSS